MQSWQTHNILIKICQISYKTWRFLHRPFLRRQESHSYMLPIMPQSDNNPPFTVDHSCVGRNLYGQCPSLLHLAILYCEIPAFAGMGWLGTGICWRILAGATNRNYISSCYDILHHRNIVRRYCSLPHRCMLHLAILYCEIPAFAGMSWLGTGICWRILAGATNRNDISSCYDILHHRNIVRRYCSLPHRCIYHYNKMPPANARWCDCRKS